MARLNKEKLFSIIIPCLNEAKTLPLLFADIKSWGNNFELIIVDGKSRDKTCLISQISGAKVLQAKQANRGLQLKIGAENSNSGWLLFMHADSRLPQNWHTQIEAAINQPFSDECGFYFDFKVKSNQIRFRLMESLVKVRTEFLKCPYGDQGLLIKKSLYNKVGGFKSIHIMEDLEFIKRLVIGHRIKSLGCPIYINKRKWENKSIVMQALKNYQLKHRWKNGEESKVLARKYYD